MTTPDGLWSASENVKAKGIRNVLALWQGAPELTHDAVAAREQPQIIQARLRHVLSGATPSSP
jgi:hypothetical protein